MPLWARSLIPVREREYQVGLSIGNAYKLENHSSIYFPVQLLIGCLTALLQVITPNSDEEPSL